MVNVANCNFYCRQFVCVGGSVDRSAVGVVFSGYRDLARFPCLLGIAKLEARVRSY